MNELDELITQRDKVLRKIHEIEHNYEGIENEQNALRMSELKQKQHRIIDEKSKLSEELKHRQSKSWFIEWEMDILSKAGINKILEAIKNQRWFFFENKLKVFMDKNTGILWADLDYLPEDEWGGQARFKSPTEAELFVSAYKADGLFNWKIPKFNEFKYAMYDNSYPFRRIRKGIGNLYSMYSTTGFYHKNDWRSICIFNNDYYYVGTTFSCSNIRLDNDTEDKLRSGGYYEPYKRECEILPCNYSLVKNSNYADNVSLKNTLYTEKERLQFTLDLFVKNKLIPIFDDDEITQLYKKIYVDKTSLNQKLQILQYQIEIKNLQLQLGICQTGTLLSSKFDYKELLGKYDIKAIDNSIIKFYTAVQQWIDELMGKLDYYEEVKGDAIRDFNNIGLKLSQNYVKNNNLTAKENDLMASRQQYFKNKFALGMNTVKTKLLAIKQQADNLEYSLEEINNSENSLHGLAVLEKQSRPSFALIAENTAEIIKNALLKIEYFEAHRDFVKNIIIIWEEWTENYKVFKTTYREELRNSCENESIEEEIWNKWYSDWQSLRFKIEEKIQPLIAYGLKNEIAVISNDEKDGTENKYNVIEALVKQLDNYKKDVDSFYLNERKGIYQEYAFHAGGDLQEKFDVESRLYKLTVKFQSSLQDIIFSCKNSEDRIFILRWANDLLNIQIDEILQFVSDNDLQEFSREVLNQFVALKQRNYEIYLSDIKAYSEEKARREQQYNSLIFKMRKNLEMKN